MGIDTQVNNTGRTRKHIVMYDKLNVLDIPLNHINCYKVNHPIYGLTKIKVSGIG